MRSLCLFILLMSSSLHADSEVDPDFEMRVSWIKSVKELLSEIEEKDNQLVVQAEKDFILKFKLMDEAWADSRYNCFYGGWPSTLIQSGGKKLCQNPARTNSSYEKSACKGNELQCQPLLFGKGLCVSFATQADRNKTFSNCENKFQKEHKGSYDFLKNPSRKDAEDMRELSVLAAEVCKDKKTGICHKIRQKLPDGLRSIEQGEKKAVAQSAAETLPPPRIENVAESADCVDPTHKHNDLARDIERVATKSLDEMYESMKTEFLSSPFCDPFKIVNDPNERPSGFLLAKLHADLRTMDFLNMKKGPKDSFYQQLADKWKFSPELKDEVLPVLNSMGPGTDDERRVLVARAKGMMLQDYLKNYKSDSTNSDLLKTELVKNRIFTENEDGEAECPFVGKEAFMKAMAGRTNVLKSHKASVTNKDQITIVDYSRPSNERRMFVLDLKTNKVLHNTWVAHGAGGNSGPGVDGFGSSPAMSNEKGSNKSSDGFIIATQKSYGNTYGNNVLLRGIDSNNTNMASRAVILHKWGSPMAEYTAGVQDYNVDTGGYSEPYDALEKVRKTDFKNSTTKEMEKAIWAISSSTSVPKYLGATEGCLGVPVINVKHLDRKGRDKSQLELLRDDLPGTIIFNYSGPEMKSKFF